MKTIVSFEISKLPPNSDITAVLLDEVVHVFINRLLVLVQDIVLECNGCKDSATWRLRQYFRMCYCRFHNRTFSC